MIRSLIRWLHLWVGLTLSLLLFVFAVTGAALVYKEAYWRLVYPQLRGPSPALTAEDHAAAVAKARQTFGEELRSVKLPEPGVNAYHLYLANGEAFLATDDFTVIDRWQPTQRAMALLFDLHAHLMAGEKGERVGGIVALFGVMLAVSGLYLWWPSRRRFSLRGTLVPRGFARHQLIAWHRDLGLLWSPVLLVLLLTAGGLVFYEAAGHALSFVFGKDPIAVTAARPEPRGGAASTPAVFNDAAKVFPDARLVFYYPPRHGEAIEHRFRVRRDCELHPNGRSFVTVDGSGALLEATDACAMGVAARTQHTFYPLHSGKATGPVYKAIILLAALVLAALSASGVVAYGRKLFGRKPRLRSAGEPLSGKSATGSRMRAHSGQARPARQRRLPFLSGRFRMSAQGGYSDRECRKAEDYRE